MTVPAGGSASKVEFVSTDARQEGIPLGSRVDDHRALGVTAVPYGDAARTVEKRPRLHTVGATVRAEATDVPPR